MSSVDAYVLFAIVALILATYKIGIAVGKFRQQALWQDHMDKCNRYIFAVDDLDRWCGHQSPHARMIARHLRAIGDSAGCNAGTPSGDEACTIPGLREQLKRLDAAINPTGGTTT
ncbi:MAG: hypothetical protein K2X64_12165 [Rhodocyclaceae bacterium]|nr:hypothetical protein [Rhodocyclaceae bacterium]